MSYDVVVSDTLRPGSARAAAALGTALDAIPVDGVVRLGAAWMLHALPERRATLAALAAAGRLDVGRDFVPLDPYALPGFRAPNRLLGAACIAGFPGARAVEVRSDASGHEARAGLCLEQRWLADRIVVRLGGTNVEAASGPLACILKALTPAGIGGRGDAVSEAAALAALRDAARLLGITDRADAPDAPAPRGRVRHFELAGASIGLDWSRSQGLRWTFGELRSCAGVASLEVQGDRGGRAAFVAGQPERPRVFEARDMRPAAFAEQEGVFVLDRELRLPVDPEEPRSRRAHTAMRLGLHLDSRTGDLELRVELRDAVPGHRYRLWLPVPFHPRPSVLAVIDAGGRVKLTEVEGETGILPVMGPVLLCASGGRVSLGGQGLREVEVFRRQNDYVCAITLLRACAGEAVPQCTRRSFVASWRENDSR